MRYVLSFLLLLLSFELSANSCLAVFPSGANSNLSSSEQLINIPVNNSSATLYSGTTLASGDNFYYSSGLHNKGAVYVPGGGNTARLFIRSSVSWQNVRINQYGNPEDLIIVIDGSLSITGGQTDINAIIYTSGAASMNGNVSFHGALASVGGMSLSGASVTYDPNAITSADFNGMCDNNPVLDHFDIVHDGSGLTCADEVVTVRACTDASCSSLSTDNISLQLQGNGSNIALVFFTGSQSISFKHTVPETVTLSVANASTTPTNGTTCNGGSNCDLVFADTGFQFLAGGTPSAIATQLSAKPSNTGFNSQTLALQAIKTNPATGACEAALTSSVVVEMAAECIDPGYCAGQAVTINGTSIATQSDSAAPANYSNVTLNFGTSSDNTADLVFSYPDAGKLQLHARYNIPVDGVPSGNYMSGSSNTFVVRPLGFYLDIPGNPAATDAGGAAFKKAGQDFTVTLTAKAWQAADDSDNNGVADSNSALSDNDATPNFGREISPDSVTLNRTLVAPNPGSNPALVNASFSNFSGGAKSRSDVSWGEVGIIAIDASLADDDYLGTGNLIGSVPYVGRFIPDHFVLATKFDGDFTGGCAAVSPFVYSGQMDASEPSKGEIRYGVAPAFTLTAQAANNDTTNNYTGAFMKMQATDITRVEPVLDATKLGADNSNNVALTASLDTATLTDEGSGVVTYSFSENDRYFYKHELNSLVAPFVADINLTISSVSDADGVLANDTDSDVTNGVLMLDPVGIEIRFGRWLLENAFGPETSNIALPMQSQYWDGTRFVANDKDSCTAFSATDITIEDISLAPATTSASGSGNFALGKSGTTVSLAAPGSGNTGEVLLKYTAPAWLQYDWNGDGLYDNNPTAVATFGLFRGNDRIIYQREINN